jgi:hypothetical protein
MNTRIASDNRPKLSNNSTAAEVDRKLAFIDNVCSLLIESRFGRKSYSPFSEFKPAAEGERSSEWMSLHEFMRPSLTDGDIDPIVDRSFTPPETARPAVHANQSSSPATSYSSTGFRAILERITEILGTHFAVFLSASIQPRGSPRRSPLCTVHY